MSDTNYSSAHSHVFGFVAAVISIAAAAGLYFNQQYVVDQLSVWQYHPTSEVASFVGRAGMNDRGKFYFYASRPSVDDAQTFNQECDRKEDGIAILGCYSDRRIYIYDVTNDQLKGIKAVTAAHEMLHAAYDRMSTSERSQVDKLLEAEYSKLKDNKDFSERMAFYSRTEPGERDNELHSVIGTEVGQLSPALEAHYKQYFTDRSKVVALHAQYASVFTKLQTESETIVTQMNQLAATIKSQSASYNADVDQLNTDIKSFNDRAKSGGFSSQAEFQNERAALLARVQTLDTMRQSINADIDRYNDLRGRLAEIASQSEALNRSIDSSLAPAPQI